MDAESSFSPSPNLMDAERLLADVEKETGNSHHLDKVVKHVDKAWFWDDLASHENVLGHMMVAAKHLDAHLIQAKTDKGYTGGDRHRNAFNELIERHKNDLEPDKNWYPKGGNRG